MRAPNSMGRGRGGRGGGGRGGGGRGGRDEGPPSVVVEVGQLMHDCESEMVCKLTEKESKIPHFNAGIFLENKKKIGKVDEIFGSIHNVMFTIKPDPGIAAKSFKKDDKFFIGTDKLLPLTRFTQPGKPSGGRGGGKVTTGRFGGRSGGRGGRGGFGRTTNAVRGGGRVGSRGGRGRGRGRF